MPKMKIYNVNDTVKDAMDGIYLDYADNTFLFMVRSDIWMDEEIKSARRNEVIFHFVQKGCVDAFLLEIEDCLECSDLPFDIHEAEDSLKQALLKEKGFSWQIVLMDQTGKVVFERSGEFEREHSELLKQKLLARLQEDYTSEDFDKSYEKLQAVYEPFELEPFAVFTERNKKK